VCCSMAVKVACCGGMISASMTDAEPRCACDSKFPTLTLGREMLACNLALGVAYSGPCRPPVSGACRAMIPAHAGPPFRSMPAGRVRRVSHRYRGLFFHSEGERPPIGPKERNSMKFRELRMVCDVVFGLELPCHDFMDISEYPSACALVPNIVMICASAFQVCLTGDAGRKNSSL
jgi:hypothetical protein